MLTQKESSLTLKRSSRKVELKVLSPNGEGFGKLELISSDPAAENKQLMASLSMMLAHSAGVNKLEKRQLLMIREAMRRNKVTCEEAVESFWAAFQDPYVSQGRIDFRHLWKHIEKMRKGEDGKVYTYEKMLAKMHKESISMDVFTMIEEETDHKNRPMWVMK